MKVFRSKAFNSVTGEEFDGIGIEAGIVSEGVYMNGACTIIISEDELRELADMIREMEEEL